MKKILFSLIACGLAVSPAFSQIATGKKGHPVNNDEVKAIKQQHQRLSPNREILGEPFYIDYSVLDNLNQGATNDYERFVWPFNSRYNTDDQGTIFNFAGVVFRDWSGYSDSNDPQGTFDQTMPGPNRYLHIDSLFVLMTHENNSGLEDTIVVQISRQQATGGFSQSAQVLWRDTTFTSETLSPGGNWLGTNVMVVKSFGPNIDLPINTFPGVSLKYFAPKADTMGILGSYTPNPNGPASPNTVPLASSYPYTYLAIPGVFDGGIFNPSTVFYTEQGGGPSIDPTSGDTVFFYVQGIEMWIKATVKEVTGIEDQNLNGIRLGNIFPNPMTETAGLYISLDKASTVSVEIFDVTGKLVATQTQGNMMAGEQKITIQASGLQAGSYMYRVVANGAASVAKKFTVVR